MLSFLSKYLTFLALVLVIVDSRIDKRVKRNDIDLQTCIEKFNVHKDKIIRTQDSQNMGAKYLNEIDLGSREECLHLCCETENCDVFVFEEKNSGSCYLFHCGPPEDFKCKFTHHVNYSSAILSINRNLPDLESQIKLTKHEQDLTKLRKPELDAEVPVHLVQETRTTSSTTTTSLPPLKQVVPESNKKSLEEEPKCTRFQFECRSTRECIAIYNACDGIPQCADGSDEGLELGCPASVGATATAFPPRPNNAPVQPLLQVKYENVQQLPMPQINNNQQGMYLQQPLIGQDNPEINSAPQRPEPDFIRPGSININSRLPYDSSGLQPYNIVQLPPQGPANWMPHQSNQLPPQINQYAEKSGGIFNHKENGFQVPDGQELSQAVQSYPKMGNYFPENSYRQPIQQQNWPSDGNGYPEQPHIPENRVPKSEYKPNTVREQLLPNIRNDDSANPKHVQEQLAHDLKHSKDNMEHGDLHASKITINHHNQHKEEQYPDVIAYKLSGANDLEDGIAQTQKGAMLSVSLGLIITFIMAILIGCRLKVVRRRMRKGGKAYAHDADFLVNGMYL